MKPARTSLAVLLSIAVTLPGCGGGGGSTSSAGVNSLTGVAVDGYLRGATVYLDLDRDGLLDDGEPSAITGANGAYTLDLGNRKPLDVAGLPIIVEGGIDNDTGYSFGGRLMAPVDPDAASQMVTPLTTLVHEQLELGLAADLAEARDNLARALGLGNAAALTADPVAALASGSDLYQKQAALQRAMEALAAVEKGADESDHDAQERIAKAFARAVKAQASSGAVDIATLVGLLTATGLNQAAAVQNAKTMVAAMAGKTEAALDAATRGGTLNGIALVLQPLDQLKVKMERELDNEGNKSLTDLARETEEEHGDRGLIAYIDGSSNAEASVERMRRATPATTNPNPIAQPANNAGRLLASNCFQCHGTLGMGGFDRIRGDADELRDYLNRPARGDIMAAHAQGYTTAQINAIVAYFNQN